MGFKGDLDVCESMALVFCLLGICRSSVLEYAHPLAQVPSLLILINTCKGKGWQE